VSVARVKSFLLIAVGKEHDAPIGEHAVAIKQQQLDARGTFFDFGQAQHSKQKRSAISYQQKTKS
jgi:hypothetical protein